MTELQVRTSITMKVLPNWEPHCARTPLCFGIPVKSVLRRLSLLSRAPEVASAVKSIPHAEEKLYLPHKYFSKAGGVQRTCKVQSDV